MPVVEYTHHTPIASSLIKKVWYASPVRELYVEMSNGSIYGYKDVSPLAYENFLLSDSKGAFYNKHVKGVYKTAGDTFNVTFRAAPGLAKKNTDANYSSWASSAVFSGPVTQTPVTAKPKKRFRVTGTVLSPTTTSTVVHAESLEDAIEQFRQNNAGKEPEVTAVTAI